MIGVRRQLLVGGSKRAFSSSPASARLAAASLPRSRNRLTGAALKSNPSPILPPSLPPLPPPTPHHPLSHPQDAAVAASLARTLDASCCSARAPRLRRRHRRAPPPTPPRSPHRPPPPPGPRQSPGFRHDTLPTAVLSRWRSVPSSHP